MRRVLVLLTSVAGLGFLASPPSRRWAMVDTAMGISSSDNPPELETSAVSLSVCGSAGYNFGPWPVETKVQAGSELAIEVCTRPAAEGTHSFRFCGDKKLVSQLWGRKPPSPHARIQLEDCFLRGQVPAYNPSGQNKLQSARMCPRGTSSITRRIRIPTATGRTVLSWRFLDFDNGEAFACADLEILGNQTQENVLQATSRLRGNRSERHKHHLPVSKKKYRPYYLAVLFILVCLLGRTRGPSILRKAKCDRSELPVFYTSPPKQQGAFFQHPVQTGDIMLPDDVASSTPSTPDRSPVRCRRQSSIMKESVEEDV